MNELTLTVNRPRKVLQTKVRKNCIVTRSMLVLGWDGVDDYCHAHFFSSVDWMRTHFVAFGSVIKNGVEFISDNELYHYVFNQWSSGYCHWLTEVAIKFLLFEDKLRDGTILIPPNAPQFVTEFLSMFGFTNTLPVEKTVFVRNLSLIQNPRHAHHLPSHMELLRKRLFENAGVNNPTKKRRIYIPREDVWARKVANEGEVIELLQRHGFEILKPESLSFEEQVRTFSECVELISIHGAGLTNSIFMPTGSRIIEFFPDLGTDPNYHVLNSAIGNRHEYLFCDLANPGDIRYGRHIQRHSDLIVDIKELAERLLSN
jgi:hypothetical protein